MAYTFEQLFFLEQESYQRKIPIVGAARGKWLWDFVAQHKPQHILEFGTANGYSGLILAHAGGSLVTIDKSAPIIKEAQEHFRQFDVNAQIMFGDGAKIAQELVATQRKFDLIFIDLEAKKYSEVFLLALELLSCDGVIICDNVNVAKLEGFREELEKNNSVSTQWIALGSGLSLSKRKN